MLVVPLAPPGSHGTARPPHLALRPCDVDDVQSIQVLDLQEVNHPVRPPRQPALSTAAPLLGWGGGGDRDSDQDPPHLQPAPLQKALHGFQLGLGITTFPLHLLQVAGVGLQGVEGPDGVLERPPEMVRMAPITAASGLCPPPWPRGPACPVPSAPPPTPWGSVPSAAPAATHAGGISAMAPRGRAGSASVCRGDAVGTGYLSARGARPFPGAPWPHGAGGGGGGHRAAQHPATHLCPGGTRPPVGASGRCSGAGTRARWCLITGANEAAELHLHGSRGTPRRTATAAARGHRCYRAPGTRTGGMAGLAPAPLRWGPGVGQAPRPQRGDTPPEQPGPVPAAGGPGDPWRFWLR